MRAVPMKRLTLPLAYAWLTLSCTGIEITEIEYDSGLILQEPAGRAVIVGGDTAGDTAGDAAGMIAGDLAGESAGMSAGDQFGLTPTPFAGEAAGEIAGESSPSGAPLCGEQRCDPNAVCLSSPEGERCQCEPRYEGDGLSCAPAPCPPNASGAPDCACDEGYEGVLRFELSSNEWVGSCRYLNPCTLITLREESFIETRTYGR